MSTAIKNRGSTIVKKRHMWSWLANHQLIQHPRKKCFNHGTCTILDGMSCNQLLASLHGAIMSQCQLRADWNLRTGGLYSLHFPVITWTLFPSSARDCGGFDWLLVGFVGKKLIEWQKKKRFLYIYIYLYLYIVWKKKRGGKAGREERLKRKKNRKRGEKIKNKGEKKRIQHQTQHSSKKSSNEYTLK